MTTQCDDARIHLLDYQRGHLAPAVHEAVRAHLERCPDCAHEDTVEQGLTEVLERVLPQYPAPRGLKRGLAVRITAPGHARSAWSRLLSPTLGGAALAAALILLVVLLRPGGQATLDGTASVVALEAVNDHLRLVEPGRALEIASSDLHRVRPWFTGRLDFAPAIAFGGDADFPLRGGAIERFLDRDAAAFVYGRRLHAISLLVFRADGLPLPHGPEATRRSISLTVRGFNVLLWRDGDLGYALVSDLNGAELRSFGARLGAPSSSGSDPRGPGTEGSR